MSIRKLFQLNQTFIVTINILLPPKLEISQENLFENPNTNFEHSVSSDLVIAARIAKQFLRFERHSTKNNALTARFSYSTFFSPTTELDI